MEEEHVRTVPPCFIRRGAHRKIGADGCSMRCIMEKDAHLHDLYGWFTGASRGRAAECEEIWKIFFRLALLRAPMDCVGK